MACLDEWQITHPVNNIDDTTVNIIILDNNEMARNDWFDYRFIIDSKSTMLKSIAKAYLYGLLWL